MRACLFLLSVAVYVSAVSTSPAQIKVAIAPGAIAGKKKAEPAIDDKKALDSMNLKAEDGNGLVEYFKKRTLSPDDMRNLEAVIAKLGDEDFETRRTASQELEKFGPGAIGILRRTSQLSSTDAEIAYRSANALKQIEKVPHAIVASAAARALATLQHPQATEAMLGFLPMSDNKKVDEDLRTAITALVVKDNKLDARVLTALKDPSPARRSAAVGALLRGTADKKDFAKQAIAAVKAILPDEKDPDTKFEASYALVTSQQDADSVRHLIDLLPDVPRGRLWQIEDYLLQLAGPASPKTKMGPAKADLEKARDDWQKWWESAKGSKDLAKFQYKPTTTGCLVMMSHDQQGYGNAMMRELGPDMQVKWHFAGIYAPAEYMILPNGNFLITEQNYQRITERDISGNQVHMFQANNYGSPFAAYRQKDGTTLVAFQRLLVEYDKTWKETGKKFTSQNDIVGVERFEDKGPIYVLIRNQNRLTRLDENWKEMANPITTQPINYYSGRMRVLPNDRVLVCESNRVVEYDFKSGKNTPAWTFTASNPSSAERLPNGNTLIAEQSGTGKIIEVTPKGETVWSYTSPDGRLPGRVIRR